MITYSLRVSCLPSLLREYFRRLLLSFRGPIAIFRGHVSLHQKTVLHKSEDEDLEINARMYGCMYVCMYLCVCVVDMYA